MKQSDRRAQNCIRMLHAHVAPHTGIASRISSCGLYEDHAQEAELPE